MPAPLSGRQAEARRNDRLILEAAREVFVEDPDAPISAVAERAGVGIGALYRRYASKEELLRRLCSEGLRRYIAEAETALADDDPWAAFAAFMCRILDAVRVPSRSPLPGPPPSWEEISRRWENQPSPRSHEASAKRSPLSRKQ